MVQVLRVQVRGGQRQSRSRMSGCARSEDSCLHSSASSLGRDNTTHHKMEEWLPEVVPFGLAMAVWFCVEIQGRNRW